MHGKGNVSLAEETRSLPERNTDAELKGGSETALSITMINIFSFVRAFFLSGRVSVSLNHQFFFYHRNCSMNRTLRSPTGAAGVDCQLNFFFTLLDSDLI